MNINQILNAISSRNNLTTEEQTILEDQFSKLLIYNILDELDQSITSAQKNKLSSTLSSEKLKSEEIIQQLETINLPQETINKITKTSFIKSLSQLSQTLGENIPENIKSEIHELKLSL